MINIILSLMLILVLGLCIYFIYVYIKLSERHEEVDVLWKEIRNKMNDLVISINDSKMLTLKKYIKNYRDDLSDEELIDFYLKLESKIVHSRKKQLKELISNIDTLKRDYNNKVLRYNNMVNSLVFLGVSRLFQFKEYIYFRDNK